MIDRMPLTPPDAINQVKLSERIELLEQRQAVRQEIEAFVKVGDWRQALLLCRQEKIPIYEIPEIADQLSVYLAGLKKETVSVLTKSEQISTEADKTLKLTQKNLREQAKRMAFIRADEALKKLDEENLDVQIQVLTEIVTASQPEWAQRWLKNLRSDLDWLRTNNWRLESARSSPEPWKELDVKPPLQNSRLAVLMEEIDETSQLKQNALGGYDTAFANLAQTFQSGSVTASKQAIHSLRDQLNRDKHLEIVPRFVYQEIIDQWHKRIVELEVVLKSMSETEQIIQSAKEQDEPEIDSLTSFERHLKKRAQKLIEQAETLPPELFVVRNNGEKIGKFYQDALQQIVQLFIQAQQKIQSARHSQTDKQERSRKNKQQSFESDQASAGIPLEGVEVPQKWQEYLDRLNKKVNDKMKLGERFFAQFDAEQGLNRIELMPSDSFQFSVLDPVKQPDDFLHLLPGENQATQNVSRRVQQNQNQSHIWLWILSGLTLLLLIAGFSYLFFFRTGESALQSNEQLAAKINLLEMSMATLEAQSLLAEPTPTEEEPVVSPQMWTFSGRLHKFGSEDGLPNSRVVLDVERSGEPFQTLGTVFLDAGGYFSIPQMFSNEPIRIRLSVIDLPAPWQLLPVDGNVWGPGDGDNVFIATFSSPEEVQPLVLKAVISRFFSGQVAITTNPANRAGMGVSGATIVLEESVDGVNWHTVDESLLTQEDGQFEYIHHSNVEQAWYRLHATLPEKYETSLQVSDIPNTQNWISGAGVLTSTQSLPAGDFNNLQLSQQVITITAPVEEVVLLPEVSVWQPGQPATNSFWITTVMSGSVDFPSAMWELPLPAGTYRLEAWTPANAADATVQYLVDVPQGFSTARSSCGLYLVEQAVQNDTWRDFQASNGRLFIQTEEESVAVVRMVIATGEDGLPTPLDKVMAVGPIRFVVTDEAVEFPECASP